MKCLLILIIDCHTRRPPSVCPESMSTVHLNTPIVKATHPQSERWDPRPLRAAKRSTPQVTSLIKWVLIIWWEMMWSWRVMKGTPPVEPTRLRNMWLSHPSNWIEASSNSNTLLRLSTVNYRLITLKRHWNHPQRWMSPLFPCSPSNPVHPRQQALSIHQCPLIPEEREIMPFSSWGRCLVSRVMGPNLQVSN